MSEQQSSYRQIMKATSIFGGVQIFNILIQIIKTKAIAVLLGPSGMGIVGLLTSTINFIETTTRFGLSTSAVKDIAEANASTNKSRIAIVVAVFRKWVWITGILGAVLLLVFSSQLSQLTFGNQDYKFAFVWTSVTLFLNQISTGQLVLLQGMRQLKYLANANLTGSVFGLIISLPIYYVWGAKGIVPVIIATSVVSLLLSWHFAQKVKIENIKVDRSTTIAEGKGMLKMGFMISLGSIITIASSYLIRIFISNKGGIDEVGLYSAGFVIIETYVGMVFSAMGTDYYPRLSAVNKDNAKIRDLVGHQAIIALLILVPIIITFLVFSKVAIQILFSDKFTPIVGMINWAILGMFFRAASWSMGFILFAKSDSKLLIKTALGFNSIFLLNNIMGYSMAGLTGLGISFFANYAIHFFALLIITRYRYQFQFYREFYILFFIGFLICIACFITSFNPNLFLKYAFNTTLIITSFLFSFIELNKRINLKEIIVNYYSKIK